MNVFIWPGYAYIPGVTDPHPDGYFKELLDTVDDDMTPQELALSDAWQAGQGYVQAGFFWEAITVWTPVVDRLPPASNEGLVGAAALDIARSGLTFMQDDHSGAAKLADSAEAYLMGLQGEVMDMHIGWFLDKLTLIRSEIEKAAST